MKRDLRVYSHYLQKMSFKNLNPVYRNRLIAFEVNEHNLSNVSQSQSLQKMLHQQPDLIQGFGFRDFDGKVVGHLFIMYKGGNEVLYKIRNIDAYIFAVRVYEDYRGQQYAGEMMTWAVEYLHSRKIDDSYLAVQKNNYPAIKAYQKLGYKTIGSRYFLRVRGITIPYMRL